MNEQERKHKALVLEDFLNKQISFLYKHNALDNLPRVEDLTAIDIQLEMNGNIKAVVNALHILIVGAMLACLIKVCSKNKAGRS